MTAHAPPAFRGRADERARLARLLENLRGGQSAVLVIRGEAGAALPRRGEQAAPA
jgi:hypothetical protein